MQYGTGGGKVSLGESMWGGLANAVSGHAYGYKLVKSAGGAFGRGFAGASVTAENARGSRDPRGMCGTGDAFSGGIERQRDSSISSKSWAMIFK